MLDINVINLKFYKLQNWEIYQKMAKILVSSLRQPVNF